MHTWVLILPVYGEDAVIATEVRIACEWYDCIVPKSKRYPRKSRMTVRDGDGEPQKDAALPRKGDLYRVVGGL